MDILLEGRRLDLGIGRGISPHAYASLGYPIGESHASFYDVIGALKASDGAERFTFDGKVYKTTVRRRRGSPRDDGAGAAVQHDPRQHGDPPSRAMSGRRAGCASATARAQRSPSWSAGTSSNPIGSHVTILAVFRRRQSQPVRFWRVISSDPSAWTPIPHTPAGSDVWSGWEWT
jgi:hypothetical protein